jgi:sugar phosphate isomerase/epimerase
MTQFASSATGIRTARGPRLAAFPKGFFDRLARREMSLSEWIELAATLGLDGVELHPAFFESFDPGDLAAARSHASSLGLDIPMLCHSPDFTLPDPAGRAGQVARTVQMIRATTTLGGRYCRVLSGQNRPGLDETEALGWVIDCLRQLVPVAEAAGVVLCLENHYKDNLWTYPEFAQRHVRYLAILDAIDSPALAAQYDPSNAIVAGEDQYALLARVLSRVATVHASDRHLENNGDTNRLVHGVVGQGLNDYDRIWKALKGVGFSGWVSIEDGEGPTIEEGMRNLRASVAFVRRLLDT